MEVPVSPADPGRDYFRSAEQVVKRLGLGSAASIRLETLKLELIDRGVEGSDPRVLRWIAPALSRSREDMQAFHDLAPVSPSTTAIQPTVAERSERPSPPPPPRRRRAWVLVAIVIAIVVAIIVAREMRDDGVQTAAPRPIVVPKDTTVVPTETQLQTELELQPWAIAAALSPLLLALLYVLFERRRRRELKRNFEPEPERAANVHFTALAPSLFEDDTVQIPLRKMRRHRSVPDTRLDIPACIAATIRAGALPQVRFGVRKQTPEYLLLAEREDPRDHLTQLARSLSRRMEALGVAHYYYEFFGTPRDVQPIVDGEPQPLEPLEGIVARHRQARPLLVMESFDCAEGPLHPEWLRTLGDLPDPAFLNPRARDCWDDAETYLNTGGFSVVPATAAGLDAYGEHVSHQARTEPAVLSLAAGRFDLPESLASDRERLLADTSPGERFAQGLVADLASWLSPEEMDWLRSIALFPRIDPALTRHLGERLDDAEETCR